jgi:hypothetical protein
MIRAEQIEYRDHRFADRSPDEPVHVWEVWVDGVLYGRVYDMALCHLLGKAGDKSPKTGFVYVGLQPWRAAWAAQRGVPLPSYESRETAALTELNLSVQRVARLPRSEAFDAV